MSISFGEECGNILEEDLHNYQQEQLDYDLYERDME